MTGPSTLNRAARLLALITPRASADAVLRRELSPRRDLPPGERRDIAHAVAAYFRWRRWLDEREPPQRQLEAALAWQRRFAAAPDAFKPETLAARAVPDWIAAAMDTVPVDWLRHLQREPVLWIRARKKFVAALPRTLGDLAPAQVTGLVESGPGSEPPATTAFRYTGPHDLFLTPAFQEGQFEIQDLASQLVGHACAPRPGETWWDTCAGEGGKTLHLADLMDNQGLIWASDRSARRLSLLKQRAARAQVFNYRAVSWDGGPRPPTKTRFDGVLIDAPCSGVGTWHRHPDARWTTSPADVYELAAIQRQLLDHAAGSLKPGGRLVYAVCTLTRAETTAVADGFAAAHPEFKPAAVFPRVPSESLEASREAQIPGLRTPTSVTLWPNEIHANGMFIAAWWKR